jgi:hypothetical protein
MTPVLVVSNTTPTHCPDCGGSLSMPLGSKARPGMVVQTCKNYQACGRAVWSATPAVTAPVVDDSSRHGRMFQIDAPPRLVAPNRWKRFTDAELAAVNQQDRKLAASGGDR